MKAQIYVNRHVVAANKKKSKETGLLADKPAISINTYKGVIYAKEIEFTAGCKLVQDAANARCSGATIWIETEFESLVIDGLKASSVMFQRMNDSKNSVPKQSKSMLYVIDGIEIRPFSEIDINKNRKHPRIYFFEKNESILAHLNRRHSRPYQEYRKLLPKIYEQLNLSFNTKASWSQYAGCSCPCSPGFILKLPDGFCYDHDIFVTVVMDLDEALTSMAKKPQLI